MAKTVPWVPEAFFPVVWSRDRGEREKQKKRQD